MERSSEIKDLQTFVPKPSRHIGHLPMSRRSGWRTWWASSVENEWPLPITIAELRLGLSA